ncbi:MAG TPA: hypothetical protein VNY56_03370 [Methylomirabilota bacterium]|nr:hypothetical protein [Methylomirabilota bacterium]
MNFPDPMRGELASMAASLLVLLSGELLKWQFPAVAAGEKLNSLASALRTIIPHSAFALIRR